MSDKATPQARIVRVIPNNPGFAAAKVNDVEEYVKDSLAGSRVLLDDSLGMVKSAIDTMVNQPLLGIPPFDSNLNLEPLQGIKFDQSPLPDILAEMNLVVDETPPDPDIDALNDSIGFNISKFEFPYDATNNHIERPSLWFYAYPTAPDIDYKLTIPEAPSDAALDVPVPTLNDIVVPSFAGLSLPSFDKGADVHAPEAPAVAFNWSNPTYLSENLEWVKASIRKFMDCWKLMPSYIEQMIFDAGRARDDLTVRKAVQEAFDTWSSNGYDMPPGMVAAQVEAAREQALLVTNQTNRDVIIKAAEWQLENVKFAIQQGMALEQILFNIFTNDVTRSFEAAKYTVESNISLYNMRVAMFNAQMQERQINFEAYKVALQGELSKLDAYRAELEVAKVKGELNVQNVQIYTARLQAASQRVEVFKARIDAVKAQADVNRARVEAYGTEVSAAATKLQGEKLKVDMYTAQIAAESNKQQMNQVAAQVFATRVGAEEARANIDLKAFELRVSQNRDRLAAFSAKVQAMQAKFTNAAEKWRAIIAARSADAQIIDSRSRTDIAKFEAESSVIDSNNRTKISEFEVRLKSYEAEMNRVLALTKIRVEGLQAQAQIGSSLAAGAMSAMHVGANLSAGTTVSSSYNENLGNSLNESHSFEGA